MEEIHYDIVNKKYSQLISDGFRLFGKNYKILVLIWLIFTVIYDILFVLLLTDIRYLYYINSINRTVYLIIYYVNTGALNIIEVILISVVSNFLFKGYTDFNIDINIEFKKAINNRLKYPIFIGLIFFIVFRVIFSLIQDFAIDYVFSMRGRISWITYLFLYLSLPFMIISIILTSFYIFVRYTYNIKDIESPIHEARSLTKGFLWKIVGVLLIDLVIFWIVSIFYMFLFPYIMINFFRNLYWSMLGAYMETRNYGLIFLYNLIYDVPIILIGPLNACLITPLFAHQYLKRVIQNLKSN